MATFDPSTFGRGLMGLGQQYGSMISQDADRRIEAMKQQVLAQIKQGDKSLDRMVQAHSVDTSDKRLALAEKADVRAESNEVRLDEKRAEEAAAAARAAIGEWHFKTLSGGAVVRDGPQGVKTTYKKPDRFVRFNKLSGKTEEQIGMDWVPIGMTAAEAEAAKGTDISLDSIYARLNPGEVVPTDKRTGAVVTPPTSEKVDTTTTWNDPEKFKEAIERDIKALRIRYGLPALSETALKEAVERVFADQMGKGRYVPPDAAETSGRKLEKGGDAVGPDGNPRGMLKRRLTQQRRSDVLDAKRTAEDRINAESFANSAEKVEEKVAEILDDKEVAKKTNTSKTVTRPLPNAGTSEEYENAEVMEIDGEAVKIPKHSHSAPALAAQRLLMKELGLSRTEALKQWANHYWATTQPNVEDPIGDFVPDAPTVTTSDVTAEDRINAESFADSAEKVEEIDTLTTNRLPYSGPGVRGFTPSAKSVIRNDSALGVNQAPLGSSDVEQSNVGEKTEQGVYTMTSDEATKYVRDILAAVEGKVAKEDIRLHLLDLLGSIPPEKANTPFAHALAQALSERTYAELAAVPETGTPSPDPALGSSGKVDATPVVGEAVGEVEGQQRATPPLTQMTYAQAETAWGNIIQTLQGNKDKAGNRTHPDRIIANELLRILSTIPPEDGDAPYAKALGAALYNLTKPLAGGTVETSVNIPSN